MTTTSLDARPEGGTRSAPRRKGLGLGLCIVKEIVHAHGGKISIESARSRGASFVIELPTQEGNA